MKNTVDVAALVNFFRSCVSLDDEVVDTAELYLGGLLQQCSQSPILIGRIDFEAFTAEDVLGYLKSGGNATNAQNIIRGLENAEAICGAKRNFF